jgi:TRAP-type C4-dicarboxylate transport system substrate-binding protein
MIIEPISSAQTFCNQEWQERNQALREKIAEVGINHLKLSDIEKIYHHYPMWPAGRAPVF